MPVRLATPADVPAMAAILAAVAAERRWILTEAPVDDDAARRRFATAVADRDHIVLVAGDPPAGMLGVHPTAVPGVATLGMSVLAEHRGHGLGAALLDAALDAAGSHGAWHKLELEVWPSNGRAVALYASRGFAVGGLRRDHHRRADGSLQSVLLMALLL